MIGNQLRKLAGITIIIALLPLPLSAAPNNSTHRIQKGDTLWSLAAKNHTTVEKIAQANGISEDAKLRIGKVIRIPTQSSGDDAILAARQAQLSLNADRARMQEVPAQPAQAADENADTAKQAQSPDNDDRASSKADSALIETALACRGLAYRSGGTSRSGFDCSGFTRYIFAKYGVSLPHSSAAQANQGAPISKSNLRPGDLVFFHTYRRGVSHVGIYIGSSQFVHAARYGRGVTVDSLNSSYYVSRYVGARRVK